jgi:hypothetical protein
MVVEVVVRAAAMAAVAAVVLLDKSVMCERCGDDSAQTWSTSTDTDTNSLTLFQTVLRMPFI